ncbi:RNA-directed RNA polymerase L [Frankliniella fusca]|uniref:RNA-directed RNA polymerase L n=1 Tax=Frankliniella fusca TaxID=407009 RepID=A0AAE1HWH0_9NEOP|nr:RNA-directed RNA polymerase L [Frankliniella fusca]KAK3913724.1 RNA-directed RNA polymerase L [Frankliniella fusca]KAK3914703.1 RNA-directed RNA polymerase L [Frankliniella fusca]KAK3916913.1 RNA-directed RNA polymerase L [Frankliniella fusca]KAK3920406.1 RNA-directed RNA polymerase L [Frankliniella fusca]
MASIFTVNEEDLFNFENFCDSKYMDANVQKYGFFKIKLDTGLAGQCSTVSEFYEQFRILSLSKIKKSILLRNPNSPSLFGLQSVKATSAERNYFTAMGKQVFKMDSNDISTNCW